MKTRRGFTLTELSVAIVFISILLLTIAVVTMNMVRNYHKGLTMKSINTVGLDLIGEFRTAISESPVFDAESLCKSLGDITSGPGKDCIDDGAQKFIWQQYSDNHFTIKKSGITRNNQKRPIHGVFCTGKYSYVWNTGYIISARHSDAHSMNSFFYENTAVNSLDNGFRLRKYSDPGRDFCRRNLTNAEAAKSYSNPTNNLATTLSTQTAISNELINDSDLALYSLTVNSPVVSQNSGRALFSGSFVLGSITGDIEVNEGENYSSCNLEGTSNFDVEYCATNKFNFAIRAMGGNSGN